MRRVPIAALAVAVTALVAAACGTPVKAGRGSRQARASRPAGSWQPSPTGRSPPRRPNIVFVLMDDFSLDLLPTLRSARVMARRGASYDNAFVVDSLCCVSRSATFTGQYPHQTGVLTNTSNLPNPSRTRSGAGAAFATHGNQARTFALELQRVGLRDGLHRQVPQRLRGAVAPASCCRRSRQGWSDFRAIFGTAYDGWDFQGTRTTSKGTTVLRSWPAPPASASPEGAGPRVRRHRDRQPGDEVPAPATRGPAAVLPPGRAVRPARPHRRPAGVRRRVVVPCRVPRPAGRLPGSAATAASLTAAT